jgi:Ser/Thr protein kinase RdoA (MazF antagonist)
MLGEWGERRCRLQPCLRDVWHDHLLFEGEALTGLVDYAAVRADDAMTDVARLAGSLVGDDEDGWRVALAAYREVRPLSEDEERLARALDRTGAVVALATWARWLAERAFEDEAQVERRLGELVRRVEGWPAG